MTNQTEQLARAVYTSAEMLETNLTAMGVTDAQANDGLYNLIAKILEIPPTVIGIELDTEINITADKQTVSINNPVTFTGRLKAFYDDETVTDVDLEGVLQGATVKLYNGDTLIGSAVTDNNGDYTFTYTPTVDNDLTVKAVFDGTDDYKPSSSTAVVITVSSYSDIVMSADKPILSYADHEKATLYAQLVDDNDAPLAIEGVTLTFKKGSTVLGTADTDSTGLATLVEGYTSQGVGDVTLSVTDGTFLTKTFAVRDAVYYNPNNITSATSSNIPNIPTNFKCLFKHTASASQNAWVEIGADSNNCVLFGRTGNLYQLGVYTRVNGSYVANQIQNNVFSDNVETEVEYSYNNGVQTIKANNTTLTLTNSQVTSRNYSAISNYGNGNIKGLTILPL